MHQWPTSEIPPGVITAADINRTLERLSGDVGTVLRRMDVSDALALQSARTDTDHETRIRRLEAFRWILVGVVVAVSASSSIISAVIIK